MEQLAQVLGLAVATLHARIARGELAIPTYVDGKMRFADTRDANHRASAASFFARRTSWLSSFITSPICSLMRLTSSL